MSNTITFLELQTQALDFADMTGSTFPITARLKEYVNKGLSILYDLLVDANEYYFLSKSSISVVADTIEYNLETDFYKMLQIWEVSSERYRRVELFNGYKSFKAPSYSATLEAWYVPTMTLLVADDDTVADAIPPLPIGWEDYVAKYAAVQLLNREESFEQAGVLTKQMSGQLAKMFSVIKPRDIKGQKKIIDVDNRFKNRMLVDYHTDLRYLVSGDKLRLVSISDIW